MTFGGTPATPQDTRRTSGVRPRSAAFSGVVTMHIDAASFCPLELPAVTVASGSCLPRMGLSLLSDSTEVSARGCSSVSITSSPARLRDGDRDDLVGQQTVLLRRDRPPMGGHGQLVLFAARNAVLAPQIFGGFDHAAGHRVVAPTGGGAATVECRREPSPRHGHRPIACRSSGRRRCSSTRRRRRPRDRSVRCPPACRPGSRPADPNHTAVQLHAGHGHRQARVQCDDTADRRRLHAGITVAEDDVLDVVGCEARALSSPLSAATPRSTAVSELNIPP